mmetsp:Transcript_3520/g.8860  ORF Transcript_3520/g.8860 Transcript_3520/m.8860 type:complete len:367 (+) Transcript_3520:1928-3028(+)
MLLLHLLSELVRVSGGGGGGGCRGQGRGVGAMLLLELVGGRHARLLLRGSNHGSIGGHASVRHVVLHGRQVVHLLLCRHAPEDTLGEVRGHGPEGGQRHVAVLLEDRLVRGGGRVDRQSRGGSNAHLLRLIELGVHPLGLLELGHDAAGGRPVALVAVPVASVPVASIPVASVAIASVAVLGPDNVARGVLAIAVAVALLLPLPGPRAVEGLEGRVGHLGLGPQPIARGVGAVLVVVRAPFPLELLLKQVQRRGPSPVVRAPVDMVVGARLQVAVLVHIHAPRVAVVRRDQTFLVLVVRVRPFLRVPVHVSVALGAHAAASILVPAGRSVHPSVASGAVRPLLAPARVVPLLLLLRLLQVVLLHVV